MNNGTYMNVFEVRNFQSVADLLVSSTAEELLEKPPSRLLGNQLPTPLGMLALAVNAAASGGSCSPR